jgi:alkane 1-monooxygenase
MIPAQLRRKAGAIMMHRLRRPARCLPEPEMTLFAVATLAPVGLLVLAAVAGGLWVWAALGYITVFAAFLDRFVPHVVPDPPKGAEFPTGARLSEILGVAHFALLAVALWAMVKSGFGPAEKAGALVAFALFFGQISHPNAHELIHRPERAARALGRWVYISLLFGHHASAHVLVHHVHVGGTNDPNSAPRGMGFYRFFLKAWAGSFRAGLRAETARRARASRALSPMGHPYVIYCIGAAVLLWLAHSLYGPWGVAAYLVIAFYAQVQILLADYVQHYGLRRALGENGKPEPVSDAHSWNARHWFTSAMMVNAPRHSDHHLRPSRPYPGLRLREGMPMLPHSLPVMAVLALFPPIWRRVMARALGRMEKTG